MMERLKDSSAAIDEQFNQRLLLILKDLNEEPTLEDEDKWNIVESKFQASVGAMLFSPLESWLETNASRYMVANGGIYGGTIDYDDMFLGWYAPLSPVIKIATLLVGTDKIGHFVAQGWDYFKLYLSVSKTPQSNESQWKRALLERGHELETTMLGFGSNGIYSYGDLAANWKGFLFYRSLFDGENPYFRKKEDGTFELARSFSIKDNVTDDFDEVLNPSRARTARLYEKIKENFLSKETRVCEKYAKNPEVFTQSNGRRMPRADYVLETSKSDESKYALKIQDLCSNDTE